MYIKNYIVVDDFYPDPDRIRDLAISSQCLPGSGNYPGFMTQDKWLTQEHIDIFSRLTNEPVADGGGLTGHFRFTKKTDRGIQHIHFDPKPKSIWAGLVYLSRQQDIDLHERPQRRCGTVFWRHDRTGLDSMFMPQEQLQQYGWHSLDDIQKFLETDGINEDLWTETFYVPPRYNRLVLFRPWLFHSAGNAFGDTRENCRLIHLIFLSLADQTEVKSESNMDITKSV